jgi:hypothetical protein
LPLPFSERKYTLVNLQVHYILNKENKQSGINPDGRGVAELAEDDWP